MDYLSKYGYTPDQEAIGRALELIAANLENVASEQVYKDCFSMMDLTTLKTDDTPASVAKLVGKVNVFNDTYPDWPLPASICVYPNFASVVAAEVESDGSVIFSVVTFDEQHAVIKHIAASVAARILFFKMVRLRINL